jgi:hypothetical protein
VAFWWFDDPHQYWLAPAASGLAPAFWVGLASLFVNLGAHPADCDGGTAVALVRRDELDTDQTVAVVVPLHKSRYPLALSPLLAGNQIALFMSMGSPAAFISLAR